MIQLNNFKSMVAWMDEKQSWLFRHIACQSTIRSGRREVPELTKLGKPGAAHLSRSSSLNRKRSFPRLFYFDAHHEQTQRDRTSTLNGYVSESATDLRASDTGASDTVWQSTPISVSRNAPGAEADEDLADFNFGDAANNGDAGQESSE